jgi:hypothetical protein
MCVHMCVCGFDCHCLVDLGVRRLCVRAPYALVIVLGPPCVRACVRACACACAPSGKCVLVSGLDGVIRLLEKATGVMLNSYRG